MIVLKYTEIFVDFLSARAEMSSRFEKGWSLTQLFKMGGGDDGLYKLEMVKELRDEN